jgi:glycine/D-amino acid oxidase-like deaminating enzyme
MKFSIRDLFLLTVIVALVLGWWVDHKRLKREVTALEVSMVSLVWTSCTVTDLRQDDGGRRILVVSNNGSISSSVVVLCSYFDTPDFRSMVSRLSIKCSTTPPSNELSSYLESRGVEPKVIVVIDGKRTASFSYTGDGLLAQQIGLFFGDNRVEKAVGFVIPKPSPRSSESKPEPLRGVPKREAQPE